MPRISIITDSTADLSPELIRRYQLGVVPLVVQFDEQTYRDGVDLTTQRLFQLVEETKHLPKTSCPSPAEYKAAFEAAVAEGGQAIYIGISTRLSGAIQNARIAAGMLPEGAVAVFDSGNLSTGVGLLVLHAWDLVSAGKSVSEIISALEQARSKVRTSFMVDTLDYIYKGGRCSGVTALVGSLLRIRPVISVVDGALAVTAKLRGPRQKGLDWMLESFQEDVRQGLVRPDRVFVTHTAVHEDSVYLMNKIRQICPEVKDVAETEAGAVVGSHCGPATIGILYLLK
jgi:DegV family protein with EDD domain